MGNHPWSVTHQPILHYLQHDQPRPARWHEHPLDDHNDADINELRAHATPGEELRNPPPLLNYRRESRRRPDALRQL